MTPLAFETMERLDARARAIRADASLSRWLRTVSDLIDEGGIGRDAAARLEQDIVNSEDDLIELAEAAEWLTGTRPGLSVTRGSLAKAIAKAAREAIAP